MLSEIKNSFIANIWLIYILKNKEYNNNNDSIVRIDHAWFGFYE